MFHNIPLPCGPQIIGEEEHRKIVEPEVQDDYRETLSQTQQDSLTYKLKAVMTACLKPAHVQVRQNPIMNVWYEVQTKAEELLQFIGLGDRKSFFFLFHGRSNRRSSNRSSTPLRVYE